MMALSELGMTEFASRRDRSSRFKWVLWGTLLLLVMYVLVRNYLFIRAGMLRPNFSVIHEAYDFNLWELPWTLSAVGVVFVVLAVIGRRIYLWGALLYAFLAIDLFALRYYVTHIEPSRHVVHRIRLETPKLSQPVRLLHLSDIQSGGIADLEDALFDVIQSVQPDIILNTGDYLQVIPPYTTESELPKLTKLIERVNPRYGTYGVYGDTDYLMYRFKLQDFEPMVMLSSSSAEVVTEGGVLNLLGLNLNQSKDYAYASRSVSHWLEESDSNAFRILFGHGPDYALGVEQLPIDLCLAGHTHGGQVRLPFFGPLVIDSEVPKDWASGFRRIGIPYLNVSAGAGCNRYQGLPPLRFNCPTEMTLIELVPMRPLP